MAVAFLRDPQRSLDLFRSSVQLLCYIAAFSSFPYLRPVAGAAPYLAATYFGSLAASLLLSLAIQLFPNPALRRVLLFLRAYLLLILGYSIDAGLPLNLILGLGYIVEVGLVERGWASLLGSCLAIALLGAVQAAPGFMAAGTLVGRPVAASTEELAAFAIILAVVAIAAWHMGRSALREREARETARVLEASIDTLAELNRDLQGYARLADEESAERERHRLSREIHDISGYIFTNLIAMMDAAGSMPRDGSERLTDLLVTARKQAQEGLRETRAALRRFREEQTGLTDCTLSIHKIVTIFRQMAQIDIDLNFGNLPHRLPRASSLALYRTVQEGLTNAVRHGKATKVRISFWVTEGEIRLSIVDNGRAAADIVKGIGISGMEERVGALGGSVSFGTTVEGGFNLSIVLPLADDEQADGAEAG